MRTTAVRPAFAIDTLSTASTTNQAAASFTATHSRAKLPYASSLRAFAVGIGTDALGCRIKWDIPFLTVVVLLLAAFSIGCGGGQSAAATPSQNTQSQTPTVSNTSSASPVTTGPHHIFVMSEENQSYSSVIGNTSQMPYINKLLSQGTLWSNFYANQHGSMHAYIETMSGTAFTCSGNDCGANGALTGPSLMDLMNAKGMAWKGYFDGLSICGQLAPQSSNWIINPDSNGKQNYYQRHTPYPWYAMAQSTISTCSGGSGNGWWPMSQFTTDLANHSFGYLNWITPDGTSDGHDGSLQQVDAFMAKWLPQLLTSSYFQPGGDGILIIWWDEAALSDVSCGGPDGTSCGGKIPMIVIGPGIQANNQDPTPSNHDSVSRFIQEQLGFTPSLGKSVSVPDFTQTFELQ